MADLILCQIRVKGHLSDQWAEWFGGLEIKNQPEGEALLSGTLPDQAALYGVLKRMRDLGLTLISVNCVQPGPDGVSSLCQPGDQGDSPVKSDDIRRGATTDRENPQQGGK